MGDLPKGRNLRERIAALAKNTAVANRAIAMEGHGPLSAGGSTWNDRMALATGPLDGCCH